MLKSAVHSLGRSYIKKINSSRAEAQVFRRHNERPIEFGFVFQKIAELRPKTVLDVGTGTTALPSLIANCGCIVTATDNVSDYWPSGMVNQHWYVIDDDIKASQLSEQFDMVTCVSVIEHIADHVAAFKGLVDRTKPGGHIVLTTPYNERRGVPNVYALPGAAYGQDAAYICRSSTRADLAQWIGCGAEVREQMFWRFWSGDVWTQGEILSVPEPTSAAQPHQLTCLLFQKPNGR